MPTKRSPLHNAVVEERIELVTDLIALDLIDKCDDNGMTPLHLAVKTRNLSIIKLLLKSGADPYSKINDDDDNSSAMFMAIETNDLSVISCFLDSTGGVNAKDGDDEYTPLHLAAMWGNSRTVKFLIGAGANVDARDSNGRTPLIKTCETAQNPSVLKLLIDAGAKATAKDQGNYTALHWAVESNDVDVSKLLIDAGANVNAKSIGRTTPVHEAAGSGCLDVFKLLIDSGGNVDAKDNRSSTPLLEAARAKNYDTLEAIINYGADVRAANDSGFTALHYATESAIRVDIRTIKMLINAGADVNAKSHHERNTPLHNASKEGNSDVLQLLIYSGANVNEYNVNGETPLSLFITTLLWKWKSENKTSIVQGLKLLIESTDVNLPDNNGDNIISAILESDRFNKIRKIFYKHILKHVAILDILDLPLHGELLNTISQKSGYDNYYKQCIQELQKAKLTRLENCWVTYLNLLVDNKTNQLIKYAGNANLIKDFVKSMHNFPIYSANMQSNISEGIVDRESFDGAANNLSYYLPIFDSFHLIIRDTLNYLNKNDWEKLCKKKRFCE